MVPAIALKKDRVMIPMPPNEMEALEDHLQISQAQEYAIKLMEKDTLDEGDAIAWSAYHAFRQEISDDLMPAITQLLPLF